MNHQRGFSLLLTFVVVLVVATGVALARMPPHPSLQHRAETQRMLAQAKEALLAYAVTYEENYASSSSQPAPGYLPCPNLQLPERNEGPDPPCGTHVPIIGRLPRLFPLRDGSVHEAIPVNLLRGEEFWYVLSRGFQNNHKPDQLNTASPGRLTVDGEGDIIAILIAPGAPLAGQHRPSTDPRDYLEGENADGDDNFTAWGDGNDELLAITRSEFDSRLATRVAGDLKRILDRAYDSEGAYPPELTASLPPWFLLNWKAVTTYSSTGATASVRFAGCAITYTLSRAATAPARSRNGCG